MLWTFFNSNLSIQYKSLEDHNHNIVSNCSVSTSVIYIYLMRHFEPKKKKEEDLCTYKYTIYMIGIKS